MQEAKSQCEMGVLENTYSISRRKAYTTKDTHEFGSIKLRGDMLGLVERTASFGYNGLPSRYSEIIDVTMETSVFPFMFPFGHGNYKGEMRFNKYIRMRIGTQFSIFTLYKPYLFIMYQLKKAIMIGNSTNSTILQRDIDLYKRKHKNSTAQDAVGNILRYILPSTLPATPSWLRRNLKDLIAVVDN